MRRESEISFPGADKYPAWLWWILLVAAGPVFIYFLINGEHFRALVSSLSIGVILTLAITLREHIKSLIYTITLVLCVVVHIAFVAKLTTEHRNFPGIILTPFAVADLLFWQYFFVTIYRTVNK